MNINNFGFYTKVFWAMGISTAGKHIRITQNSATILFYLELRLKLILRQLRHHFFHLHARIYTRFKYDKAL